MPSIVCILNIDLVGFYVFCSWQLNNRTDFHCLLEKLSNTQLDKVLLSVFLLISNILEYTRMSGNYLEALIYG